MVVFTQTGRLFRRSKLRESRLNPRKHISLRKHGKFWKNYSWSYFFRTKFTPRIIGGLLFYRVRGDSFLSIPLEGEVEIRLTYD